MCYLYYIYVLSIKVRAVISSGFLAPFFIDFILKSATAWHGNLTKTMEN